MNKYNIIIISNGNIFSKKEILKFNQIDNLIKTILQIEQK